ncbi:MAG: hypothetical protein EBZ98_03090, partial [Actinobacteria bacterium]|nr:hypothetical protein [Actinomycetota bacterium]
MAALASLVILASCASAQEESAGAEQNCLVTAPVEGRAPRIVSTVAPITSLIAQVVGDSGATVTGVVPEGTNSHTFEPPPSAAQVL